LPLLHFAKGIWICRLSALFDAVRGDYIRNRSRSLDAIQEDKEPVRNYSFCSEETGPRVIDFVSYIYSNRNLQGGILRPYLRRIMHLKGLIPPDLLYNVRVIPNLFGDLDFFKLIGEALASF
jgi:hypothetical protein